MTRTNLRYVFTFHKLHKGWKKGKAPPNLVFCKYEQDRDMCVISALDEYLRRTEPWRKVNQTTQLLLSFLKPHGEVACSTIAGWVTESTRDDRH